MRRYTSKQKRERRVRSKIVGTKERPRLSVFRSNVHIYAQLIDDEQRKTIMGVSEKQLEKEEKLKKIEKARKLGKLLAKMAVEKHIIRVVFDRGSYAYHGRTKALAEGAREGGLQF